METVVGTINKSPLLFIPPYVVEKAIVMKEPVHPRKNPDEAYVEENINKIKGHAADPIRSREKLNRMIAAGYENGDYCKITRFILGINTGFRDSDLRNIKVKDIFKPDGTVKDFYAVYEVKTRDTRKIPTPRIAYLNDTVKKALKFLVTVEGKRPQDYLFTADRKKHLRKYIEGYYVDKDGKTKALKTSEKIDENGTEHLESFMQTGDYCAYLKKLAKSLGMDEHCSTHCMRQTFGFWFKHTKSQWELDNNIIVDDDADITLLSFAFRHSSRRVTAEHYSRIPARVEQERELEMNLGKEAVDNFVDNFLQ